ncbi:MAG: peptidase M22 [Opitutaceae bacterium]|nr:peptidase M22 [Opitutaceae bacterium]
MPSLHQLRADHAPLLLIDAASTHIQVGCLAATGEDRWACANEESGIGIFCGVEALQCDLADIRAFVFCDGPGSILGIRTAAMALRTWHMLKPRPVYRYGSLELVAHALGQPDTQIIADARRETWHRYRLGGRLERIAANELSGQLVMPAGFRHWSPLPKDVTETPYTLAALLPAIENAAIFTETDVLDAFLHEEPSYKTWTPQIHRAP